MSQDQHTAIRRFIVRHIQDQDFAEDDGIPGRVLIHLCLERFYPMAQDPEVIWTEKKSIEGVIRRMVEDSMLQPVNKHKKVVFRLDPYFNIKDKLNPIASQPNEDPQSTQEALEALDKETSPESEDQDIDQLMDDDLDLQLAQHLDESMDQIDQTEEEQEGGAEEVGDDQAERQQDAQIEASVANCAGIHQKYQPVHNSTERLQEAEEAARIEVASHAEAYAEITRGAAPIPRTYTAEEEEDEDPIRTPGRKRRKVMAIAASDASSVMDPTSPAKCPNSTPRRRRVRLGTPLFASRRRSAPCNSPTKMRSPEHMERIFVKEERTDTSPAWLKAKVDDVRSEYPGSSIISENGLVKCLDCEGRTFRPAGNQSLHPVITHLRGKSHQVNATRRQEKIRSSECFFPTTHKTMEINMPQDPLAVFANPIQEPQQNIANAASAFVKALQDDARYKGIRTTVLESRVQDMQNMNKEQQEHVNASLAAFEKQKSEQQELVSSMLVSLEETHKELCEEVAHKIQSVEERSKEYLQKIEARVTASEVESKKKLSNLDNLFERFNQRNLNKFDDITDHVNESQKSSKERDSQLAEEIKNLKEINEGQNVTICESELQINEKTKHLQKIIEVQNSTVLVMKSEVGQNTVKIEEFRETIKARNQEIYGLKLKLDDNIEQMKEYQAATKAQIEKIQDLESQSEGTNQKTEELEKIVEAQYENIHDLESQCQLLRDAQEQHGKVIADQLEAHFQQTEKQLSEARNESEEQKKQIQGLVAWVQTFRRSFEARESVRHKYEKDTTAKIRSLESAKKDQDYYKEGLEDMLSGIMEDVVEVRQLVDTICSSATKAKTSPVKTRAAA